jgi:hypothetical protein
MASLFASAAHSHAYRQRSDDVIADVILQLSRENDELAEEVLQLRAAVQIYSELADRLSGRQHHTSRGSHGTL